MKIAIHEFRSIKTLMFQDASRVVNLDILVTKLQENVNVLRLQQDYNVKGVLLTVGGMILQKAVR
jgi:hypothetical protein